MVTGIAKLTHTIIAAWRFFAYLPQCHGSHGLPKSVAYLHESIGILLIFVLIGSAAYIESRSLNPR